MVLYHIEKKVRETLKASIFATSINKRRTDFLRKEMQDKVAAEELIAVVCPIGKIVSEITWNWIVETLKTNNSFRVIGCVAV